MANYPTFSVDVKDADGDPVCNATVTLTEDDYEVVLEEEANGSYTGKVGVNGTYEVSVEAEGFISQTTDQTLQKTEDGCTTQQDTIQITLESDPDFDGSAASNDCVESNDGGSSEDAGSDNDDAGAPDND